MARAWGKHLLFHENNSFLGIGEGGTYYFYQRLKILNNCSSESPVYHSASGHVTKLHSASFTWLIRLFLSPTDSCPCCVRDFTPLVRHPIGPTPHWSDTPLIRHPIDPTPIGPTPHWSNTPMVRHPIDPTPHPIGPTKIKINWYEKNIKIIRNRGLKMTKIPDSTTTLAQRCQRWHDPNRGGIYREQLTRKHRCWRMRRMLTEIWFCDDAWWVIIDFEMAFYLYPRVIRVGNHG